MPAKNITVSAEFPTSNQAQRALDHLIAAGFGKTSLVERALEAGRVELAIHCDTTEEMDAARQVCHDTAAENVDARTENESIFDF